MTWAEWLNFWGLAFQIGGVLGLIHWYLKRVHALADGGLGGVVQRFLVRLGIRARRGLDHRRVITDDSDVRDSLGAPNVEARLQRLEEALDAHGRRQRKHERQQATSDQDQADIARQAEHKAARVGALSSAAIVLGLLLQLVGALVS